MTIRRTDISTSTHYTYVDNYIFLLSCSTIDSTGQKSFRSKGDCSKCTSGVHSSVNSLN